MLFLDTSHSGRDSFAVSGTVPGTWNFELPRSGMADVGSWPSSLCMACNSISAMASGDAWMVISCERIVRTEGWRSGSMGAFDGADSVDTLRECEDTLDAVEPSDLSSSESLSEDELSSTLSSGMDWTRTVWDAFVASGRMMDHGGDSFIRSAQSISPCASHSFNFLATHGFCVQRSLEKYALQAWMFDSGWP